MDIRWILRVMNRQETDPDYLDEDEDEEDR